MNYKGIIAVSSVVIATLGGAAYAKTTENTRETRTKEEVCLNLLAKADEKAQNKQAYEDKINEIIEKINNFEVPADAGADTGDVEARRAEALAKANELKSRLSAVFAEYEAVRPTIDCSNPEDALAKVKEARSNVQGGSFVSKYVGDLNISGLNAEAKTVREQVKSVFGSMVAK